MTPDRLREIADDEREADIARFYAATNTDILVLPESRLPDDVGVYDDGLIDLVKDLQERGCLVSWADSADQRQYVGRKSAAILLSFCISVGATAAWDVVKVLFRSAPWKSARVRCEIYRQTDADGSKQEKLTYEGPGDGLAELIERSLPPAIPVGHGDDAAAPPALAAGSDDDGTASGPEADNGKTPLVPPL